MTATVDEFDSTLALAATGILRDFNRAGVILAADVHVASRLTKLLAESNESVALACALVARAVRAGSVCLDLTEVRDEVGDDGAELTWPDLDGWLVALAASPLLAASHPLHLEGTRLYFDRYWREEEQVELDLRRRAGRAAPDIADEAALLAGLDRLFPGTPYIEQRTAAETAARQPTTVLTGGPGTGKTTTVAGLLALLAEQAEIAGDRRPRIALTAPTGKAAGRLEEAVRREMSERLTPKDTDRLGEFHARTLHMLLGGRPDSSTRFRHDRDNRLPHDIIVVDETSMVSLTMMARLLEAVRPEARLILVGDPDQLASIEAGAVLADLVEGLVAGGHIEAAKLRTSHRFGSEIGDLALAVREDRADDVLAVLRSSGGRVHFVEDDDPRETLRSALLPDVLAIREAAEAGDTDAALAALDRHRLLCAHREGLWGVNHWNRTVERWITEETEDPLWDTWYVGRPVLVTANDYALGIYNGDVGVAIRRPDGSLRVCIDSSRGRLDFAPTRLGNIETLHAMTIHKAQGSQAAEVTILMPGEESRLLTRELFYTAVTRAQDRVRVVGTETAVRLALSRRALRATGLSQRLTGGN
ncbi:exodeoxyribonuclease V subunit alpha [Kribbella sp. VKM Ac-2568]|uniref:exodeoxyribonuclease V subunit alpha n=1 Tax=Kribbella sp. VKM Ac-2568 TaxID=2512219 RepID=UPI0010454FEC|nr:exodeoxyribonuclease V subunit alpha [Kribbella sp. VKM Ac-2568]TCM34424.1 DNA helicase/exodeoxyribonuclease V alpha subunit [Kribbella sp. VKM Ac-2568]